MDSNRIFITGGGGYLGSNLAKKMAPTGVECYLFDRAFNTTSIKLSESSSNVHLMEGDLNDLQRLIKTCQDILPTHILHFAASLDRSRDFSVYNDISRVNVGGTLNLLKALEDIPYEFFGFSSTSDVYGTQNTLPFHEDQLPSPVSPYSLTKLMAEDMIRTWSVLHDKPFTIFRIFLFIGPGMPPNTFIGQLQRAFRNNTEFLMTKGEQKRDYLSLEDLLESISLVLHKKNANGEILNICSGSSVSMKEIAGSVQEISGNCLRISDILPYRENEIWEIRGSNEKLKRLLPEFQPGSVINYINSLFTL
jgi:nucleoside-diphosphate-sugar epimerase